MYLLLELYWLEKKIHEHWRDEAKRARSDHSDEVLVTVEASILAEKAAAFAGINFGDR